MGSVWLLAALALVFAAGSVFGLRYSPYGLLYRQLVRPRLGPPSELEPEAPPRFAQTVGLVFAVVGVAGYAAGLTWLGVVATAAALATAFLNGVFGVCLGCEMYLLIRRIWPSRESLAAIGQLNLVDVRSPDEFAGRLLAPAHLPQEQAQRGGHIPTAKNVLGPRRPPMTGRSSPARHCAPSTLTRQGLTSVRTPSPTAGSGSVPRIPGSSCTSCSACQTSRTTTGRGPSTVRWWASR